MKLVIIVGGAAVGKMSVGKELATQCDLRLFHNHVTIEPVVEVFGYYDMKIINRLRYVFWNEFAKTNLTGMVFTMMFDFNSEREYDYITGIKQIFETELNKRNEPLEFYFIELDASQKIRLQRNVTEQRLEAKPTKRDIEVSNQRLINDDLDGRFVSNDTDRIPWDNFLKIENDNLSIEEQVKIIREKFNI